MKKYEIELVNRLIDKIMDEGVEILVNSAWLKKYNIKTYKHLLDKMELVDIEDFKNGSWLIKYVFDYDYDSFFIRLTAGRTRLDLERYQIIEEGWVNKNHIICEFGVEFIRALLSSEVI